MADVENGTDETQLPSYLTRHAELGFDSEDIAALIGSIDSSQTAKQSSLPHLPAEILFQILEHVPISYVLSWRLVCRGFRDAIDGPVMLQCLKRMQLIGYLGDRGERPLCPLTDEQYYDIWLVRADFERLEDVTSNQPDSAKWSPAHAVFRIEERWYEHYDSIADHLRVGALVGIGPLQSIIFERLQLLGEQEVHGTLRWCIRLDEAVLDINFPIDASAEYIEIDIDKKMVTIQWKYLLQRFLKVETLFRITMTKKQDSAFTFGYREDCLRKVRRERLRAALDMNNRVDRRIDWEMNLLPPLFGRPRYEIDSSQFDGIERAEDEATTVLMLLRKEASLTGRQIAYIAHLIEERKKMEKRLKLIDETFALWKREMFKVAAFAPALKLPKLPQHPALWTDEMILQEEEQVKKWQSQEDMLTKMVAMLKSSIDAVTLPDDAFEEIGSDF